MSLIVIIKHSDGRLTDLRVDENHRIESSQIFHSYSEIPPIDAKDIFIALLPGEHVSLTYVKMPKTRRAELERAVPFALEEEVATDVTQLYFALGDFVEDKLFVAVIDKAYFIHEIEAIKAAGLQPIVMLPNYLALQLEKNSWTVVLDGTMAIVRTSRTSGFSVEFKNLILLLKLQLQKTPNNMPKRIIIFKGEADVSVKDFSPVGVSVDIRDGKLVDTLAFEELLHKPTINLLQGKYRPKFRIPRIERRWRIAAAALGILLLLFIGGHVGELLFFKMQSKRLEEKIETVYKDIYPNAIQVIEPKVRVTQTLTRLRTAATGNAFLLLMIRTGKVIHDNPQVTLQSLAFQNKELQIRVRVPNLSSLETLTQSLIQQGLNIQQNILTSDQQTVTAELRIRG